MCVAIPVGHQVLSPAMTETSGKQPPKTVTSGRDGKRPAKTASPGHQAGGKRKNSAKTTVSSTRAGMNGKQLANTVTPSRQPDAELRTETATSSYQSVVSSSAGILQDEMRRKDEVEVIEVESDGESEDEMLRVMRERLLLSLSNKRAKKEEQVCGGVCVRVCMRL